jgi:hypothetical protein
MNTEKWYIKSKYFKMSIPSPFLQAAVIGLIATLMMLAGSIFNDPEVPWLVSGALTLLFLVFNNALGIFAERHFRYIQLSLYAFMILIVGLSFLAYLISGQTIFDDGGINRTIFVVMIMANFGLLGLTVMIRNIADFLQKKDENLHKNGRI